MSNRALLLVALLASCGGCDTKPAVNRELTRLWGTEKLDAEFAEKAKETIDAYGLEERPDLKSRVLAMRFEEIVARMGFVEYSGTARFLLKRNGHTIDVPENSVIRHGLHGSFSVRQVDQDGQINREVIYNNGVLYGQNGAKAKMRVMGMIKDAGPRIRDEAWQPLRVFSSYYGPRFGMKKLGAATVAGRSAANYQLVLLDGSPLVEVSGMKGAKKPISIAGNVYVDDATGAPIKASLTGQLEIPPEKPDQEPGALSLSLNYEIKTIEGAEIKPKEFIPEIKRREVDLDPLAFLEGETRTSTVIGGHRTATPPPAPPVTPPPAVTPPPPTPPPPATTTVEPLEKPEKEATIPSKPMPKKKAKKTKKKKR